MLAPLDEVTACSDDSVMSRKTVDAHQWNDAFTVPSTLDTNDDYGFIEVDWWKSFIWINSRTSNV